jgi:peptidoglycan hydrolase-like protein with peptidoglycan-binding domain
VLLLFGAIIKKIILKSMEAIKGGVAGALAAFVVMTLYSSFAAEPMSPVLPGDLSASVLSAEMNTAAQNGLSETQIQAVLNLLSSFGAQDSVVSNVESSLRGRGHNGDAPRPPRPNFGTSTDSHMGSSTEDHMGRPDVPPGLAKNNFPGASACGLLMRNLRRGSSGDDVHQLQNFLLNSGDLDTGTTTGFFGEKTERALQNWQARMGVANSGDANSTGFGALGPKTRMIMMMKCKEGIGFNTHEGTTSPRGDDHQGTSTSQHAPVCTLSASKETISAGESVTLTWASQFATSASVAGGGTNGPTQGSIVVSPVQTTTYLKTVYGPAGQGTCTRQVTVASTTPVVQQQIVMNDDSTNSDPFGIGQAVSLIGSGMAAVIEGYVSLFN